MITSCSIQSVRVQGPEAVAVSAHRHVPSSASLLGAAMHMGPTEVIKTLLDPALVPRSVSSPSLFLSSLAIRDRQQASIDFYPFCDLASDTLSFTRRPPNYDQI